MGITKMGESGGRLHCVVLADRMPDLPGEFASDMTVRRNGDFSFSYKGQIQLVGLANLLNNDFLGDERQS